MALDSGIAKMGLFAFIFIVVFAGLLSLTPSEFAVATKDYGDPSSAVPEFWNGINLLAFNFTGAWNWTLKANNAEYPTFSVGGRNLRFSYSHSSITGIKIEGLFHRYGFGLLFEEAMDWYNRQGILKSYQYGTPISAATLGWEQLNEDFEDFANIQFDVVCLGLGAGSSYFKVKTLFWFNETAYSTPTEAWDNSDLDILVGINFSDSNTALNIWYLITCLLTFNTVEVFGSTGTEVLILNGILAALFFAPIAIFAGAVLLEVLPF